MNKKESFYKKWKRGMGMIDDVQLMESKIAGHKGVMWSMVIAFAVFLKRLVTYKIGSESWFINLAFVSMFIFFMFLQYIEIKKTRNTIRDLIKEKQEFELEEKENGSL